MAEERTEGIAQFLYIFDDGRFGIGGPPTNNDRDAELDGNLSIIELKNILNCPQVEEKDGYHYPCNSRTY